MLCRLTPKFTYIFLKKMCILHVDGHRPSVKVVKQFQKFFSICKG